MDYICTICTEPLEIQDEKPIFLPCGHTFHKTCSGTWIELSNRCSICNTETESADIQNLYLSSNTARTYDASDLEAIAKVAKLELKDSKEALKESRLANKYLLSEIKIYKNNALESATFASRSAAAAAASAVSSAQYVRELTESKRKHDETLKRLEREALDFRNQKTVMKKKENELLSYIKKKENELAAYKTELAKTQQMLNSQVRKAQDVQRKLDETRTIFTKEYRKTALLQHQLRQITYEKDVLTEKITRDTEETNKKIDLFTIMFD